MERERERWRERDGERERGGEREREMEMERERDRERGREREGERKKAMLFSINLSRAFSLKRSVGMSNILVIQSRRNILKGAWRGLVTRDVIRMVWF